MTFEKRAAFLIVNSKVFPLREGITTIGRTLENDLIIQDDAVSRHHAEIHHEGDCYVLKDLQSSSGTYLNTTRIEESTLYSGDLILLANVPMMFVGEEAEVIDGAPTTSLYGMISTKPE